MAKFRLVKNAGPHREGGRVYYAGETVESEKDLMKSFHGKFRLIEGSLETDDDDAPEEPHKGYTPYDTVNTKRHPPAPVLAPKDVVDPEDVQEELDPEQPDIDETQQDADDDADPVDGSRKKKKKKKDKSKKFGGASSSGHTFHSTN